MKTVTLSREAFEKFVAAAKELRTDLTEWLSELGSDTSPCDLNNRDDIRSFDLALARVKPVRRRR